MFYVSQFPEKFSEVYYDYLNAKDQQTQKAIADTIRRQWKMYVKGM
jgi:hypothetical protein